ncbi:hypothetical protein CY34DRAFT_594607 [Suillus luteus UH-Slu-Lm8-n1]|uniref:Uncharacterized protein n=1 Tax=Suillus luteus UH-Slu-Lm8-n1 TaxID=930992 RepID=A0A0D0BFB3_9AGAM|nr:hypothetical protein CY34DRAFT_594607 [Suillus luteus UH-Slu-Lm8-n1]
MCGTRSPWLPLKLMTPNAIHSLSLSASRQTKFADWHTRFDIPCDVLQVRFAGGFLRQNDGKYKNFVPRW